jgi:prepilin-type N-terminal cleavage/methylation domain-containing protein
MLARIRKAQEEREGGFTLIELLVVIIIIGILAAIAIPVFLNQRKKGVDASMKSDARSVANEMETLFTDTQTYAAPNTTQAVTNAKLTTGNSAVVTSNATNDAYCVVVSRTAGSQPGSQSAWVYVSSQGGLQAAGVTACPASY